MIKEELQKALKRQRDLQTRRVDLQKQMDTAGKQGAHAWAAKLSKDLKRLDGVITEHNAVVVDMQAMQVDIEDVVPKKK